MRLAVLAALARARTVAGRSPEDALAMLVRAIEQAESRSTKYGSIGAPSLLLSPPFTLQSCTEFLRISRAQKLREDGGSGS